MLRKAYVMNYGYQEIITLMNMQDGRLLRVKDKKLDWTKVKKTFKLINEEVRINDPVDISYVYNGYSPLSVKFIETVMTSHGFKTIDDSKYHILTVLRGADVARSSDISCERA